MAKRRHTAEQVIAKCREAALLLARGTKLSQVCRKLGVTEQTYYRWRKEYGGDRPITGRPVGAAGRRVAGTASGRQGASRGGGKGRP